MGPNQQRSHSVQPSRFARGRAAFRHDDHGFRNQVGTINIEYAVSGTNEGRRDFEALDKKLEPKKNELKAQNDELESSAKAVADAGRQAQ